MFIGLTPVVQKVPHSRKQFLSGTIAYLGLVPMVYRKGFITMPGGEVHERGGQLERSEERVAEDGGLLRLQHLLGESHR